MILNYSDTAEKQIQQPQPKERRKPYNLLKNVGGAGQDKRQQKRLKCFNYSFYYKMIVDNRDFLTVYKRYAIGLTGAMFTFEK